MLFCSNMTPPGFGGFRAPLRGAAGLVRAPRVPMIFLRKKIISTRGNLRSPQLGRKVVFTKLPRTTVGFTLIEVMVVVIILAVVAGAILPTMMSSIGTTKLDTAASQIGGIMDFCYSSASATGRVHGLIFNSDKRRFQVVAEADPDPEAPASLFEPPQLVPVSLPGLLDRELPEDLILESVEAFEEDLLTGENDEARILFFPDGTTEFANLYLTDSAGEQRVVELNGFNGVVTISVPEPEEEGSEA